MWDNRATPGPVSLANGDFSAPAAHAAARPTRALVGGAAAVVCNASLLGGAAQYVSANASVGVFSPIYGSASWSYEAWVWHTDTAGYCPVFSWGVGGGASGAGAAMYVGAQGWGAAGHDGSSNIAWGAGGATTRVGSYYMPTTGAWHYTVVTYNGTTEAAYLDGVLSSTAAHALSIARPAGLPIVVGGWLAGSVGSAISGGSVAIGALRMYVGALTAADVGALFTADAPAYGVTAANNAQLVITFTTVVVGVNASTVASAGAALRTALSCALGVPASSVTITSVTDGTIMYAVDALVLANAAGPTAPCAGIGGRRMLVGGAAATANETTTLVIDVATGDAASAADVAAAVADLAISNSSVATTLGSNLGDFVAETGALPEDVNFVPPTSPSATATPAASPDGQSQVAGGGESAGAL